MQKHHTKRMAKEMARRAGLARAAMLRAAVPSRRGIHASKAVGPDALQVAQHAKDALAYEASMGHVDARGRNARFSEFARGHFARVMLDVSLERRMDWSVMLSAFERYPELSVIERKQLVSDAQKFILEHMSQTPQAKAEARAERHERFLKAARASAQKEEGIESKNDDGWNGEQRTDTWFRIRSSRLTASSFANALGFFNEGREVLWEEKLGLREAFSGNDATEWGTQQEERAVQRYVELTGYEIEHRMFSTAGKDADAEGWLGASPDGLIQAGPGLEELGPGVLEVKCPFNKGSPQEAKPYPRIPFYYVPQVQGLMEVLDREWCDLFCWTVNGSAIYRVNRDPKYWKMCYEALGEFWWAHVIPAKHALAEGDRDKAEKLRPPHLHRWSKILRSQSIVISQKAPVTVYPAEDR